jgi:hypothetical protein
MFISTMPAVSPTFALVSSVSISVASVVFIHNAILNEDLTVFELPVIEQALLHQNISFHGVSTSRKKGPCILPRFRV